MSKEILPSQNNPPLKIALQLQPSNDQFKRRRVTRACDECRKKKVKCDGQQPCIHCTVYSYNCTYNKPTKRTLTQRQSDQIIDNSISNIRPNHGSTSNVNSPVTPTTVTSTVSTIPNINVINLNTKLNNTQNVSHDKSISPNSLGNMGTFSLASSSTTTFDSNIQNNITSTNSSKIKGKSVTINSKSQSRIGKYQQLFSELLPNLPDINNIDIPLFLQIIRNFKNNSDTFLDDATKEYYMIINNTTTATISSSSSSNALIEPSFQTPYYFNSDNMSGSTSNKSKINDNNGNKKSSVSLVDSTIKGPNGKNQSTIYYSLSPPVQSIGREIKIILPPKPVALLFVKNTWEYCCVLLRFYHRPSFLKQLDDLYETDPNNYTTEQMKFLPLCYAIMAVGALFTKSVEQNNNNNNNVNGNAINNNSNYINTNTNKKNNSNNIVFMDSNNNIIKESPSVNTHWKDPTIVNENNFMQDEGYKYFIAARKLLDITNTRDLNSIQAVLALFIFLQCSARLSTCYSYIGVAMRSVLREGFHRKVPDNSPLSLIEIECRKRLFFTVYKLDIYVNAMLGLPKSISPDDWDQTLPLDISDNNITDDKIYFERQNNVLSDTGISNYHTKLLLILDLIVRELYPIKKTNNVISHETITQLEIKLKKWVDELPMELKPDAKSIPSQYERANKLLHLSFLHVQIILYRPFIHFLSRNFVSSNTDKLSLQRANNSINVARTVVRMAQDMVNKNLISGSYWYACYTIFYSVAGLLFYIHEADLPDKDSARKYYEILKDAERGRDVLMHLKDTSMAANRTYNILNKLFEKLNSKTIQLSAKCSSSFNKRSPLNETSSAPSSDISQTSSYNIKRFVKDVSNFSDYRNQNTPSNCVKNTKISSIHSTEELTNGGSDMITDHNSSSNKNVSHNNNSSFKNMDKKTIVNTSDDLFVKKVPTNSKIVSYPDTNQDQLFDCSTSYMMNSSANTQTNNDVTQFSLNESPPISLNIDSNNNDKFAGDIDTNNNKAVKLEHLNDDNIGIFDIFDKLDAQLFGKYNVTSEYQNPITSNLDQNKNTNN